MADDKTKLKGSGEATIENVETGEKSKVEFEGTATVTSLTEKRDEKENSCLECHDELTRVGNKWVCTNPNCTQAQAQASTGGSRSTAKAQAAAPPRAFNSRGRVD